jgi:hypothetical protein
MYGSSPAAGRTLTDEHPPDTRTEPGGAANHLVRAFVLVRPTPCAACDRLRGHAPFPTVGARQQFSKGNPCAP